VPKFVADSSVSPTGLKWAVDPVADVVTTAGDLIYGTAADTVARLGIGTASQVLAVNSGATAPEWVTPAGGSTYSGCVLYASTVTAISNTTFTTFNWDSEELDTDGFHSTVTNTSRITIPAGKGGKYMVHTQITWENNNSGERVIELQKNGSLYVFNRGITNNTNSNSRVALFVLDLVETDYPNWDWIAKMQEPPARVLINSIFNQCRIFDIDLGAKVLR
jgi:hypothetical protein